MRQIEIQFYQKIDWGTIPPLEGEKGGGHLDTLFYRSLAMFSYALTSSQLMVFFN